MQTNNVVVIAFWCSFGIPAPQLEYPFAPGRKFRADYCWPDARLIVECEGGVWSGGKHGRGSGIVKDMERSNFAAVNGYRMMRFMPRELLLETTAQQIVAALTWKTL